MESELLRPEPILIQFYIFFSSSRNLFHRTCSGLSRTEIAGGKLIYFLQFLCPYLYRPPEKVEYNSFYLLELQNTQGFVFVNIGVIGCGAILYKMERRMETGVEILHLLLLDFESINCQVICCIYLLPDLSNTTTMKQYPPKFSFYYLDLNIVCGGIIVIIPKYVLVAKGYQISL